VSLVDRLARLFREPSTDAPEAGSDVDYRGDGGAAPSDDGDSTDGNGATDGTTAVAVVVQAPPAGVRRFELTVRTDAPVAGVDPGLLTRHFETFDDGLGVVRARAVDVDGHGRDVETATPLFVVRFADRVDPDAVALDGTVDGHDEEPVPWSRLRLTPVDAD
jgi:hypothetical protein